MVLNQNNWVYYQNQIDKYCYSFRGNVGVVMFNHASDIFSIKKGDRIAQLVCEKIEYPDAEESQVALDETERGEGGFGSTGTN